MTRHKAYTKIPFAALFFAATLISPALHALNIPDYRFHTMPETSYYGGIHSIAKDSVGRMWFSGYDALFMYNGTSFVRMTRPSHEPLAEFLLVLRTGDHGQPERPVRRD